MISSEEKPILRHDAFASQGLIRVSWCHLAWISVIFSGTAYASDEICAPIGGSRTELECITDEQFINVLVGNEDRQTGPRWRPADIAYDFSEIRVASEVGPDDVLVIDVGYRFRAGRVIQQSVSPGIRHLSKPLPNIYWWDYWRAAYMKPKMIREAEQLESSTQRVMSGVGGFQKEMKSASTEVSIEWTGVNTNTQVLYGPEGEMATWGCNGYESIDTCKACCMATRSTMLAAIWAIAKYCHASANACAAFFGVGALACHAACAVAETAAIGYLVYSMNRCNKNCEQSYLNHTSVEWVAPHLYRLHWGDAVECRGWPYQVARMPWAINEREHISIPGTPITEPKWDLDGSELRCVMLDDDLYSPVREELRTLPRGVEVKVFGEPAQCPPATQLTATLGWLGRESVEGSHEGIICIRKAMDYRIVDIDPEIPGNQIPTVGILEADSSGLFIERINGGSLSLRFPDRFANLEVELFIGTLLGYRYKYGLEGVIVGNKMHVKNLHQLGVW